MGEFKKEAFPFWVPEKSWAVQEKILNFSQLSQQRGWHFLNTSTHYNMPKWSMTFLGDFYLQIWVRIKNRLGVYGCSLMGIIHLNRCVARIGKEMGYYLALVFQFTGRGCLSTTTTGHIKHLWGPPWCLRDKGSTPDLRRSHMPQSN